MTDAPQTHDGPDVTAADPAPAAPAKDDAIDILLASIRAATTPGASSEARAIGAAACRTILTSLEGKASQRPSAPNATTTGNPTASASPLAALLPQLGTIIPQLATMPKEQLRELVGAVVRNVLPAGRPTKPATRYRTAPARSGQQRPSR